MGFLFRSLRYFYPMNRFVICIVCAVLMISCKGKKKKPEVPVSNFVPVATHLKSELAKLDTSLFSFYKIETVNGKTDTVPIKNSDVKLYAKDFLNLPDITKPEVKDDYKIDQLFDEVQDAFIFMYSTNEDHPVKREDVTVSTQPNTEGQSNIRSIFIQLWQKKNNTLTQKNLMWETGKRFEVVDIDERGKNKRLQVIWNNFESSNQ